MGHILVTQQLLVYALSGTQPEISNELIEQFRKGTAPEKFVDSQLIETITSKLETTVEQFVEDYKKGIFGPYKQYPTSYGVTLHSLEEAIIFNNMHEALHLGYIMALKRTL
jgi:hypothetical protein